MWTLKDQQARTFEFHTDYSLPLLRPFLSVSGVPLYEEWYVGGKKLCSISPSPHPVSH